MKAKLTTYILLFLILSGCVQKHDILDKIKQDLKELNHQNLCNFCGISELECTLKIFNDKSLSKKERISEYNKCEQTSKICYEARNCKFTR